MKPIIIRIALGSVAALPVSGEIPVDWPAGYPGWWWNDDPALRVVDYTLAPGNTSPINQGQLLHIAEQGIAELNVQLAPVGGAGFTVAAFLDADESNYYAPANLSQLKHVSSKFYERFADVGFIPIAPDPLNVGQFSSLLLIADRVDGSAPGVPVYPWVHNLSAENKAIANIGQAKFLFSWDIAAWVLIDSEDNGDGTFGDGLPDWWENYWFKDLSHSNTTNADQDDIFNRIEFLIGSNPTKESRKSTAEDSMEVFRPL